MPFDDDAEADNPGFRKPPHPDDRLWRHPSEMRDHPISPIDGGARGRSAPPLAPTAGGRGRRRSWVPIVAAGVAGAVVTGAGIAVFGLRERVVERPVVERVAMGPTADMLGAPAEREGGDTEPTVVAVSNAGSHGSGVVVRDDGIVVTSAALVPQEGVPRVLLPDGGRPDVEIVGVDPVTGLAVLDLAGGGYVPSVLAGAADIVPGASVSAIGAAGDGGAAVDSADGEMGSARRFVGPSGAALDGLEVRGDARSRALGGPVVDGRGAVLGVTTAVDDGVAWYAAPVAVVQRVTDGLLDDGVVRHSWLGIEGTDATGGEGGTLVASVVPGSPAADGGLQAGDRVIALDGDEIADMAALLVALRARAPGDRVDVTLVRADGTEATLVVRLQAAPTS